MKTMQLFGFIAIVLLAGSLLPVQAGLNAKMEKIVSSAGFASFISFVTGSLALFIYLIVAKTDLSLFARSVHAPWYLWLAGLFGAFYVTVVILMAPKLGVALTFGLLVTGQMMLSVILDHFGLLGLAERPVSPGRAIGVLLLIAGVLIIRRS